MRKLRLKKKSSFISYIAVFFLFSFSIFLFINQLTGKIIFDSYEGTGFAPPYDVYNINSLIFNVTPEQNVVNDLDVVVDQAGGFIYKTGYFYNLSSGNWIAFNFSEQTVGNSVWIPNYASFSLNSDDFPFSSGLNFVAVFSCKKYNGQWKCGCESMEDSVCNKWMVQAFNVSSTSGSSCVPNCSQNASYNIGQNFSDGCGGNCVGSAPHLAISVSGLGNPYEYSTITDSGTVVAMAGGYYSTTFPYGSPINFNVSSNVLDVSWFYSINNGGNISFIPNTNFSGLGVGTYSVNIFANKSYGINPNTYNERDYAKYGFCVTGMITEGKTIKHPCTSCEKNPYLSCSSDYTPVCSSVKETYSNGCLACQQGADSWTAGACDRGNKSGPVPV